MRIRFRQAFAVLCCLCVFLVPAAGAESAFHPMSLLSGDAEAPVLVTLSSPEAQFISAYDENRALQLNRLMKHLSLEIGIRKSKSGLRLLSDGHEALSYNVEHGSGDLFRTELTDVLYPEDRDNPGTENETLRFLSRVFEPLNLCLNALQPVMAGLPEAFPEYARSMEASLGLSGYGKAVRKILITIPAENAQTTFRDALCSLCPEGEVRTFISSLVFSGQQKISILLDQAGTALRFNYDGKAGLSEEDLRTVSLVWKCLREGNRKKDGLTLKTPSQKETNRFNITLDRDLNPDDPAAPQWKWTIEADEKTGPDRTLSQFSMEWSQNGRVLAGRMTHQDNKNGEKSTLTAEASMTEDEGGVFSGGLEITQKKGKIEKDRFSVQIAVSPDRSEAKTAEDAADDAPREEAARTKENDRRKLLHALLQLPDEDLLFLFSGLPEEEWQALVRDAAVSVVDEQ